MKRPRVLVVDSNPDHAELIAKTLEHHIDGLQAEIEASAAAGLSKLSRRRFQLVIVENGLPDLSGLRFLREMRSMGCTIPVILTSEAASERLAVRAMREGAADYLSKTSEFFAALPHIVRRVLETHHLESQLEDWQRKYAELLNNASDAVFFLDTKGRFVSVNLAAERLLGLQREQLVGKPFTEFVTESSQRRLLVATRRKPRKSIRVSNLEIDALRPDGRTVPVELSAWPIFRNGRVVGYQAQVREISERKAALERERQLTRQLQETVEKLERKTAELEESQRLQSQFISNVSHEFRTPLNGILGYAELLRDGFYGDLTQEQREALKNIVSCGQHLLELVNEILDLAKIQTHQLKLLLEPCTPKDVLEPVVGTIRPLVEEKGLELRLGPCEERPLILCDLQRVYQVLLNLASNAVKFTERGFVELGATPRDSYVEFYVRDTGSGIPADKREEIFRQFVQLDGSISRKHGGLGIGLSLSRQLVELHGGEIGVESQEGVGSRFYFTIPIYAEEQEAPFAVNERVESAVSKSDGR